MTRAKPKRTIADPSAALPPLKPVKAIGGVAGPTPGPPGKVLFGAVARVVTATGVAAPGRALPPVWGGAGT